MADINIVELDNEDIEILIDGSIVSWSEIYGDPVRCRALMKLLETLLKLKVDCNEPIEPDTRCKISYDEKGLVISGEDLTIEDLPELLLEYITDVIATADEVNILHGLLLTTEELNSLKPLVDGFNPEDLTYLTGLTGNIQEQLDGKQEQLTFEPEDKANKTNSYTSQNTETYPSSKALYEGLRNKQDGLSTLQLQAVNSGVTKEIVNKYKEQIDKFDGIIPAEAHKDNQLADKQYVRNFVNDHAGLFVTKDNKGNSFNTYAELAISTTFYHNGMIKRVSDNDYAVVLKDETHGGASTRYYYHKDTIYNEGHWTYQYTFGLSDITGIVEQILRKHGLIS